MGGHDDERERAPPRNAVVVRQAIEEIWNQGNLDLADTLFTAAYINSGGLVPDLVRGPEAIKLAATLHHAAFPGLHITIEQLVAEGASVAFRWVARNHAPDAPLAGISESSRQSVRGMTFCRLASGKIVESWTSWDAGGLVRKLVGVAGLGPGRDAPLPNGLN
jgi:hypothetical protein